LIIQYDPSANIFRSAPIVERQFFVSRDKPVAPAAYALTDLGGVWLAADAELPLAQVTDAEQRSLGVILGYAYSARADAFLPAGGFEAPVAVRNADELETALLPDLSGMFVFISAGTLPPRIYMDPGGSFPVVYSPEDGAAGSTAALLFDEAEYRARFRPDLHEALIGREGSGGWISGSLTAHRGVQRVLPNHYLDMSDWSARRFWPRLGDFSEWRDLEVATASAAAALRSFSAAASATFDIAVTLTAGFDSRLLMASCRSSLDRCLFFTLEAPAGEMDVHVSRRLAEQYGLNHRVMPLAHASDQQMAIWDRMVGDCMVEAPRRTHLTLRALTTCNAVFTGMYGEVGRCRLYRQDLREINAKTVDARFIVDRLTLPPHSELLESITHWRAGLEGQPSSVIMDLAFHELKFGNWAMGQRPISNSIKLNLLPFAQRPVIDAFIGVAPEQKQTDQLFWGLIRRLWPELEEVPINKYGDSRDYLGVWKKLTNPNRVRRFLRDRFARSRTQS
jgi:hypothetical protein